MNWEAVSAIGELIGALAVLLTLVFLIVQIRQNTIALQQQGSRESTSSLAQLTGVVMQPEVASIICRAYQGEDPELTIPESLVLEQFVLGWLLVFQQDFLEWRKGMHVSEIWESRLPVIRAIFVAGWVRNWWATIGKDYFMQDFHNVIDKFLQDSARDDGNYWKRLSTN